MALDSFRIKKSLSLEPLSVAPTNPTDGDIYFDDTLGYRLFEDGDWINLSELGASVYDAIVGSPAEVASGAATHTTIQSAVNDTPSLGAIFILNGTYTENVTISGKTLSIAGKGYGSYLNGTLTVNTSAHSSFRDFRVSGLISLATTATESKFTDLHLQNLSPQYLISDLGTNNSFSPERIGTTQTGQFGVNLIEINWNTSTVFQESIDATMASPLSFTFANARSGQTIILSVYNPLGSSKTVAFPPIVTESGFTRTVSATSRSVFTFVKIGSLIYGAVVPGVAATAS